jgi:pyrimidine-specific ribonucleoside hydrolase
MVRMKPVILDVDTGLDDACALLLAARHPDLDLRGVTCVGGNVGIDQVVPNTLTVLEAAGRSDVPVARGAAGPLLEVATPAPHVHGTDGLGDLDWPRSTRTPRAGTRSSSSATCCWTLLATTSRSRWSRWRR